MEELLEVVTWNHIGFMVKPVGVLNVGGYFDHLLKFFDHAVQEVHPGKPNQKDPPILLRLLLLLLVLSLSLVLGNGQETTSLDARATATFSAAS